MDEKQIDNEIAKIRDRFYRTAGLNSEEARHLSQRIHELQQLKRSIKDPESFLKPVRQYVTEDVAKKRIQKALGLTRNEQLLLLEI